MSSEPSTPMTSASAANSRDSEPEPQARSSSVRGTAPWWRRKTSRPLSVEVNKNYGLAGVAYWLNQTLHLEGESKISKNDPRTAILKEWVDKQYSDGRMTFISEEEMEAATCALLPELAKQAGLL